MNLSLQKIIAACTLLLAPSGAVAQTYWEMTPYNIHVSLAIDPALESGSGISAEIASQLAERTDNFIGAAWQLSVSRMEREPRQRILNHLDQLKIDDLGTLPQGCDKAVAMRIGTTPDGSYQIAAREFDTRTLTWGAVATGQTRQAAMVADVAFQVLYRAFAPLAQIDVDAEKNVLLRLRAAGLATRDPQLPLVRVGDVFRPVIRKIDRKGKTSKGGVQAMPWTFLVVEKVDGSHANCKLQSGLRQSFGKRRGGGQSEQFAIAVRPRGESTRLTVQTRGKSPQPLAGYDVFAQVPNAKTTTLVGRTDGTGSLDIPSSDDDPVRLLYVKGGGILLAKLPMVPGLEATAIAEVADEDVRLALEGYLNALNDTVVDLVARREILMARTRNRITTGNLEAAEKFYDELRRLPTREQITFAINAEISRNPTKDAAVQAKIKKLAEKIQKEVVDKFLDSRNLDTLRTELNKAKTAKPAEKVTS